MKTILIILLIVGIKNQAFSQKDLIGNWLTASKDAKVQIYEKEGKYFGKIIWVELKNPNDIPKDKKNPDESLRNRNIIGMNILTNFIYDGENEWTDGEIYDPNNGKTYSCNMKLKGNKLEIRGYVGISLFGRTEVWERDLGIK